MDPEKMLLKSPTKGQYNRIIQWVGDDAARYKLLVGLFFKGEYRLTQHAAWPMSYCIRLYPALAKPYIGIFIKHLSRENMPIAEKRNIVRLLQFVDTPKRYQGKLMDICFRFVTDPEEAIAVKAFSLTILERLSYLYPEILPEIKSIIDARWEFETPAFRTRAKKILFKLKA